jgi:peptide/nickel transport system permease protein
MPETFATPVPAKTNKPRGYWGDVWARYKRNKLAMLALGLVVLMLIVGLFAPFIAGTKPILCKFKGSYYCPALVYYHRGWENNIFLKEKIKQVDYDPAVLKQKDPDSWVIWPLFYQDPVEYLDLQTKKRLLNYEHDPDWKDPPLEYEQGPSRFHPFGTNNEGVDVLAALVHGTRIAILIGFVSTGIAALIGIPLGALAGYFGGWVDTIISRIIEVFLCIPSLVLIMAIIAVVEKPQIWHVMAVIGITSWTSIARLTRAEFLKLRQMDYVSAAQALGAGNTRIMFKHILPNSLAPILVPITFGIATAILIESGLTLLGLTGDTTPARWGALLSSARQDLNKWWLVVFPGTAIFLSVCAYNLIGEGLQEATDPRLRNR